MRILIVNSHFSKVMGGSEVQCHQIASTLLTGPESGIYLAVGGLGELDARPEYEVAEVETNGKAILKACLGQQPDIVYWRYNKRFLADVIPGLKKAGISLIFSVSHIHDLKPFSYKSIPGLSLVGKLKRRFKHLLKGFKYGQALKQVDGVVCNNEDHVKEIKHPRKCYIPNSPFLESLPFSWERPYVVWVGNLKEHKHPERFIELSRGLETEVDFLMVGHIQQTAYDYVNDPRATPPRFHFLGPKEARLTNGIIQNALFLVHTCEPEGFPNVFLQAWGFSKPVVSLHFDPGGLLEKEGVGFISGNYTKFKAQVSQLLEDESLRKQQGEKAHRLINREFIKEKNVQRLIDFIVQVKSQV